jgi:hypothetical protein
MTIHMDGPLLHVVTLTSAPLHQYRCIIKKWQTYFAPCVSRLIETHEPGGAPLGTAQWLDDQIERIVFIVSGTNQNSEVNMPMAMGQCCQNSTTVQLYFDYSRPRPARASRHNDQHLELHVRSSNSSRPKVVQVITWY